MQGGDSTFVSMSDWTLWYKLIFMRGMRKNISMEPLNCDLFLVSRFSPSSQSSFGSKDIAVSQRCFYCFNNKICSKRVRGTAFSKFLTSCRSLKRGEQVKKRRKEKTNDGDYSVCETNSSQKMFFCRHVTESFCLNGSSVKGSVVTGFRSAPLQEGRPARVPNPYFLLVLSFKAFYSFYCYPSSFVLL